MSIYSPFFVQLHPAKTLLQSISTLLDLCEKPLSRHLERGFYITKGIALSGFHLVWTIPLVVPAGHDPATH